jgi:hypothetical protein
LQVICSSSFSCPTAAPQHRPSSAAAASISQAPKLHSNSSSASTNASKKKQNDAEAFLEANELQGSDSSVPALSSRQLPSSSAVKPAAAPRQQTTQFDSTQPAPSSAAATKAVAKSIPAPLLAAAKKAGMVIAAQSSTKSAKVPAGSPAVSAKAPISVSGPSQSEMDVAVLAPAVNFTLVAMKEPNAKLPYEEELQKGNGKAADEDDGRTLSPAKAAPSIPVRRKRIVDSDDSDDTPAFRPSVAATPTSSDAPAASPASVASSKKPRVSILSSRVSSAAATADAAATYEESAAGAREVEELLECGGTAPVVHASTDAAATVSSAPAKSGLKIGASSRPARSCLHFYSFHFHTPFTALKRRISSDENF